MTLPSCAATSWLIEAEEVVAEHERAKIGIHAWSAAAFEGEAPAGLIGWSVPGASAFESAHHAGSASFLASDFYASGEGGQQAACRGCKDERPRVPGPPQLRKHGAAWRHRGARAVADNLGLQDFYGNGTAQSSSSHRSSEESLKDRRGSVAEVLQSAVLAATAEVALGELSDDIWAQLEELRQALQWASDPKLVPPPQFQQVMSTCVKCLLRAPEGSLQHPEEMVRLLSDQSTSGVWRYLDWLEMAVQNLGPTSTPLGPACVAKAVNTWHSERALLQASADALLDAVQRFAPQHSRSCAEWVRLEEVAKSSASRVGLHGLHRQQQCGSSRLSRGASPWTSGAPRIGRARAHHLQPMLSEQSVAACHAKVDGCQSTVRRARQQVRRHVQNFKLVLRRFTKVANQLVEWTSTVLPKIRVLEAQQADLVAALRLQSSLQTLVLDRLEAEDDLDLLEVEERKAERHAQVARERNCDLTAAPTFLACLDDASRGALHARIEDARHRLRTITENISGTREKLKQVESGLPFVLAVQESPSLPQTEEMRLARKVAGADLFHEDVAVHVSEMQDEQESLLRQVAAPAHAKESLVEAAFMCPILHERMREPVSAADGHTYERHAIVKWLQMHNTSPMTGAPLAHRFLTQNFVLRRAIRSRELLEACSIEGVKTAGGLGDQETALEWEQEEEDEEEEDEDDVPEEDEDDQEGATALRHSWTLS